MFKLGSGASAPLPAPFTLRTPLTMSALHRPCAPSLVVALLILTSLGILYHKDKFKQAICNDYHHSEACCGLPCCQIPNGTDLPLHTPMNLATDINDKGPLATINMIIVSLHPSTDGWRAETRPRLAPMTLRHPIKRTS